MNRKNVALLTAGVLLALAGTAQAESTFVTGTASPLTTTARVDFQVTIPRFLSLQVGSVNGIDLVDFTVAAANVGSTTAVAGTGGDLGAGTVTARVIGNNGNVTLNATTTGDLTNAAGDTIPWTQISTASNAAGLPAPTLANGTSGNVTVPGNLAGGRVVNQNAVWTYTYLNDNIVPAGTYGGVGVQNGRVTYTASML